MNERIKELYKEAYGVQLSIQDFVLDSNEKKFAELIVRECAGVVFRKTGPKSALNVLEHFGVEE